MALAVRPIAFFPNGDIDVVHDETGHTGLVSLMDQEYQVRLDGSVDEDWIGIDCPGCDSRSYQPVGGGCSRGLVQKMFARSWMMRAEELGIPPAERGWPRIRDRVCAHADAMDGPGSCRITGMQGPNDDPDDVIPSGGAGG
jgi:hypothetical protein